jgi:hypothetical protein
VVNRSTPGTAHADAATVIAVVIRELTNRAVEHQRRFLTLLFDERDLQAALAMCTDDATLTLGDQGGLVVRNDNVEAWYEDILNTTETFAWSLEAVAVRGDLLCLTRNHARRSDSGSEVDLHIVLEINDAGLATRSARFDDEDLKAAHDCLNQWWIESLPPELATVAATAAKLARSAHEGDAKALDGLLDDDLVFTDHRPLGFGQVDKHDTIDLFVSAYQESPGYVALLKTIERLTPAGYVGGGSAVSTNGFVTTPIALAIVEDKLIAHAEYFDANDLEKALARFDELTSTSPS